MRFGIRELIFLVVLLAVPVASWWYVFNPRNAEIQQALRMFTLFFATAYVNLTPVCLFTATRPCDNSINDDNFIFISTPFGYGS